MRTYNDEDMISEFYWNTKASRYRNFIEVYNERVLVAQLPSAEFNLWAAHLYTWKAKYIIIENQKVDFDQRFLYP